MSRNLRNLLRLNARKGEFKAEANTIWLYDVIVSDELEAEWTGGIAPRPFIDALKSMTGPVHIRINSPGGDVFGATAMAQAMREYKGEITCHVDGVAASAASVLAISGSKMVMAPGSLLMIHNAWTMAVGDRNDLLDTASLLEKVDGMLAEGYALKSGGSADEYRKMMDAETWFTPAEAVAAKLADSIAEKETATASASWDLSVFAKAPQAATNQATSASISAATATTQAASATTQANAAAIQASLAVVAAAPTIIRTTTVTECTETEVETVTTEVISGDPATMPADATESEIEARARKHAVAMLLKTA